MGWGQASSSGVAFLERRTESLQVPLPIDIGIEFPDAVAIGILEAAVTVDIIIAIVEVALEIVEVNISVPMFIY